MDNPLLDFLFGLGAYLLGSVPFGLLVARAMGGVDPRTGGSKNIGATNVARLAGKPAGVITLFLDVAKGAAPTLAALSWLEPLQAAVVGLCAFAGHLWPLYLRFRGGKGVSTALGVFLALSPAAAAGVIAVFLFAAWHWGHVSMGSLLGCGSAPVWLLLAGQNWAVAAVSVVMALLVLWRHKENISRIRQGREFGLNRDA